MDRNDLINELRAAAEVEGPGTMCHLLNEAADEIEALDERVAIMAESRDVETEPEKVENVLRIIFDSNDYKERSTLIAAKPKIVRCKDCIHAAYVFEPGVLPYIKCCGVDHELDWFCADGERRLNG